MKKRVIGFGVSVVTAVALITGLQMSIASATSVSDWCSTTGTSTKGAVCVADASDGTGSKGIFKVGAADLSKFKTGSLNKHVSVLKNNSPNFVYVYETANYSGTCAYYKPGTQIKFDELDNNISSLRLGTPSYNSYWCKNGVDSSSKADSSGEQGDYQGENGDPSSSESSNSGEASDSDSRFTSQHPDFSWCKDDALVCVADADNGTLDHGTFKKSVSDLGDVDGGKLDDSISIVKNQSSKWIYVFSDSDYDGKCRAYRPGSTHNFSAKDSINDSVTSIKIGSSQKDTDICSQ